MLLRPQAEAAKIDSDSDDDVFSAALKSNKPKRSAKDTHSLPERARDHTNPFRTLSYIALNLCTVPVMSSKRDHVLSESKRLITGDRNHLCAETIEAVQCQKCWLDNHIV